jgi:4-carboxymuconolactone decarboxylase
LSARDGDLTRSSEAACGVLRALAGGTAPAASAHLGSSLDRRAKALVALGALIATGAAPGAYARLVDDALGAGVTPDEVVDMLVEVAPILGLARLVPIAGQVGCALGYDVDRALEVFDD